MTSQGTTNAQIDINMQCQSQISYDYYRTIRDDERTQCKRVVLYKLDGKYLCANHASLLLLKKAIEFKTIEVLDVVQKRKKFKNVPNDRKSS